MVHTHFFRFLANDQVLEFFGNMIRENDQAQQRKNKRKPAVQNKPKLSKSDKQTLRILLAFREVVQGENTPSQAAKMYKVTITALKCED